MHWYWIVLIILGYILLWGLTSSLLYKISPLAYEDCLILGSLCPFTLPFAMVVITFNLFNKLFK